MPLNYSDTQGLLVSAYAHLPCSAFCLLHIREAIAARSWLSLVVPHVTTAEGKQTARSINVAITHAGLTALGLGNDSLATFPTALQDMGMASSRRSRVLGDEGSNHPEHWVWGGPNSPEVHLLLLIYACDE